MQRRIIVKMVAVTLVLGESVAGYGCPFAADKSPAGKAEEAKGPIPSQTKFGDMDIVLFPEGP